MAALWALILLQVAYVAVAPLPGYHSQYGQDKYIMDHFFDEQYGPWENRRGVFVEVGAGDGLHLSNTLAFEERLGWRGILIEPVLHAFEALKENRPNCTALHTCIAHTQQEYLLVSNSEDGGLNSFLTTPSGLTNTSIVHDRLQCTSLSNALSDFFHGSPGHVDYLSIDVEGNELSVLQSIDFNLYTIDVISVEVDVQDVSVHRFLTAHRFRFLERLVDDAIYVYRRGFSPDPTCMLPNTQLEAGTSEEVSMLASSGGWGSVRELTWRLYPKLSEMVVTLALHAGTVKDLLDNPVFLIDDDLVDRIRRVLYLFYREDADKLLEECPVGMLTVSILTRFMEAFYGNERTAMDIDAISVSDLVWLFAKHFHEGTFFLPTEAVFKPMIKSVEERWWENVKQRESWAEPVSAQKFPLGRAFHEMGFADVLASGWPLFGYLELASLTINRLRKTIMSDSSDSAAKRSPEFALLVWPRPSCRFGSLGTTVSTVQLQDWSESNLLQADYVQRAVTASTWELIFDADVCGLLALAIAKFHAAKTQFGDLPKVVERIPLRNQTLVLPRNLDDPELRCFVTRVRAMDARDRIHDFLIPCGMEIVTQAGTPWLQVSRKVLGTRSLRQVGEGERLWRSYVRKYGLLSAVSIMHYRPLLPDGLSNGFSDLHALQEELLVN